MDPQGSDEKPAIKLVLKVGAPEVASTVGAGELGAKDRGPRHKRKHKRSKDKYRDRDEFDSESKKLKAEELTQEVEIKKVPNEAVLRLQQEAGVLDTTHSDSDTGSVLSSVRDGGEEGAAGAAEAKKNRLQQEAEEWMTRTEGRVPRDIARSPLYQCLSYIQRTLQRKDNREFFSQPVTDVIAPGYSSLISRPMDFSTMRDNIDKALYSTINQYWEDFKTMCENAMKYNAPDTIYHREAKKMLGSGMKLMSKEKLTSLRRSLNFMTDLTPEQLGFNPDAGKTPAAPSSSAATVTSSDAPAVVAMVTEEASEQVQQVRRQILSEHHRRNPRFEAVVDKLTPEQILEQAQKAAGEAAAKLSLRKPHSKMGFLRRRRDGTTSFRILNPDNTGIVNAKERIVTLGEATGKLSHGTGNIVTFREDKRNRAVPVSYLNYGPFNSHAPVYDSAASGVRKEDCDLMLGAYGSETGMQYALSTKRFVSGCGDYVIGLVDGMLNVLTGGEHEKVMAAFKQKIKEEETPKPSTPDKTATPDKEAAKTDTTADEDGDKEEADIDFKGLRSLQTDLGLDMSFLDSIEAHLSDEKAAEAQLGKSADLLSQLAETQHSRLSQPLPPHLAQVPKPSEHESKIAQQVREELTGLIKQVDPGDVASSEAIREALGISLDEVVLDEEDTDLQPSGGGGEEENGLEQPSGEEGEKMETGGEASQADA